MSRSNRQHWNSIVQTKRMFRLVITIVITGVLLLFLLLSEILERVTVGNIIFITRCNNLTVFDENGVAQLMDVNPRIDATVSIFAAGGLNLPYLCIKKMLGEDLPEVSVRYGTKLKRRYLEMFTDQEGKLLSW